MLTDDEVPLHTSVSGAVYVVALVTLNERSACVPLIVDTGSTAILLPPSFTATEALAAEAAAEALDVIDYMSTSCGGTWLRGDVTIGRWALAQVPVFLAVRAPLDGSGMLGMSPRSALLSTFGRLTLSLHSPARLSMSPLERGHVTRTGVATWSAAVASISIAGRVIARDIVATIDSGSSHVICPRRAFQLFLTSRGARDIQLCMEDGLVVRVEAKLYHSDHDGWVLGIPFILALRSLSFDARRGELRLETLLE
jgi:hypothetical protein